jgi:hypothetical protein
MLSGKFKICREIILGLSFLGIPSERFSELKKEHGGLVELHIFVEKQISGF